MARGPTWWLRITGGARFRISAAGLLIGRAPECDLVLSDHRASRSQAIVFAGAGAPRLAVLGKGLTEVNGAPVEHERELADGDRIALPGLALEVAVDAAPAAVAPPVIWLLHTSTSGMVRIARTPFAVGGPDADLCYDGWPATVMRFHVGERFEVEAVEPLLVDDLELDPGEIEALAPASVVSYRSERLRLVAGGTVTDASTFAESARKTVLPHHVRVDFLPRGGRLTVRIADREVSVYLADRRCDLVAALLRPPEPYAAGDFVPDDTLVPRIWPGQAKTRVDLNVLLHRVRRDLTRAELDGAMLLPRIKGGNATRFAIAAGATVDLA